MIEEIIPFVKEQMSNNEFFSAGISVSIFTAAMYQARAMPQKIWNWLKIISTTKITISNDDLDFFRGAMLHLQESKTIIRQSSFNSISKRANRWDTDSASEGIIKIGIGYGIHYYKLGKYLCKVNYYVDNEVKSFEKPVERIEITALSRRSKKCKEDLFSSIISNSKNVSKSNDIKLFKANGEYWDSVRGIPKRNLRTVYTSNGIKENICKVIDRFIDSRESCVKKGIPWRLSMILSGLPGSGKTSLSMAIASHYDMPMYYLPLNSVSSDSQLLDLVSGIPPKSIIMIEDVDCANTKKRSGEDKKENEQKGVSTSGLLNALDGIMTPHGRVLIMTTNHYENLDPAMVRAGRADYHFIIDKLDLPAAREMANRICPDKKIDDKDLIGKTGAELEVLLKELI